MEQDHPDRPSDSIVPIDFYGMSADEIIEVHRTVYGTDESPPVAVEEWGPQGELAPAIDTTDAFIVGLERLCTHHPAEGAEVLAKLSLSDHDRGT